MRVLLVHGLGRTPASLFGLASALRRAGHHTRFFGYSPTFESLPRIVARLTRRLQSLAPPGQPVGLVGHSLGGLLLRLALPDAPGLRVHHLVMLGTPHRPPRLARLAWRWLPFRLFTGDCGRLLASPERFAHLPGLDVPYTTVAGTAGPRSQRGPFAGEPNDGIVAVSETLVNPDDSPVLVPAWHTLMMNHPAVRSCVIAAMGRA